MSADSFAKWAITTALIFWGTLPADAIELSDTKISQMLVGSWITPSDSSDYTGEEKFAVETFYDNGTLALIVYSDETCRSITETAHANWVVRNGLLFTYGRPGATLEDHIVSIVGGKLTLQSADGRLTYTREKGTVCGQPIS